MERLQVLIRHLLSIAALPFMVAVVIPIWLARRYSIQPTLAATFPQITAQIAGLVLCVIGVVLFASSLRRFATEGEGTLAPWDPPRRLVLHGPYRYVRNPMISGVIFVLFGEALILLSRPHITWALTFLALNFIYIPLLEEPQLKRRFGEDYVEYCRHVPRLFPRIKPWDADPSK
jgi:protein-S-isoprenylcysteine O-methyltransferase Ste14